MVIIMKLNELRKLYEKVRIRYEATLDKAKELLPITVLVKRDDLLKVVGSAIYYNSSYTAFENYTSVEDYIDSELVECIEELTVIDKSVELNDATAVFIELLPFEERDINKNSNSILNHLGMSYLSAIPFDEMKLYPALSILSIGDIEDESKMEAEILATWYTNKINKMLTNLRNLETAVMSYLLKWKNRKECNFEFSKDFYPILEDLRLMFIKWDKPVSFGFGSDADKTNTVRDLPANLEALLNN